jgi:hypothetical protein
VTSYPDLTLCISWASSMETSNRCVCYSRVHSDSDIVKANVLVDRDHRSRLADFGLAKVLYSTTTAATTLAGGPSGTVRWMAPELWELDDGRGFNQVTVRSDIYALAITIWEVRPGGVCLRALWKHTDAASAALHAGEAVPAHRARRRRATSRLRRRASGQTALPRAHRIQRGAVGHDEARMEHGPAGPADAFSFQCCLGASQQER